MLFRSRSVFRSALLLDQDRAVRSANLATAYRDAGMPETGHREASRAVLDDYANFSAHLFLHETYEALRDPKQFNLRYDNARLGEFLIGNLLAPAGASSLSQGISQQEYTRLFDTKRFGVNSATEYSSHGDWTQTGSQFGNFGNFSYALDGAYRSERGYRPNNDLEQRDVTFRAKIGFCNCATGVSDDEELERIGDVHMIGERSATLADGQPVVVGHMKGRSRPYSIDAGDANLFVLSVAFNDRCDVIVATAQSRDATPDDFERPVMAFLTSAYVLRWAELTLGL